MFERKLVIPAIALILSGCVPGAGDIGKSELTVEQCRAYYTHSSRLFGGDVKQMYDDETFNLLVQGCVDGVVSKRHFDCAMAAKSREAIEQCGPVNK
jgi:hypothetical protein